MALSSRYGGILNTIIPARPSMTTPLLTEEVRAGVRARQRPHPDRGEEPAALGIGLEHGTPNTRRMRQTVPLPDSIPPVMPTRRRITAVGRLSVSCVELSMLMALRSMRNGAAVHLKQDLVFSPVPPPCHGCR